MTPDWIGLLKNNIGGNTILTNITITDPEDPTPTVHIVLNTFGHNLNCSAIGPYLSVRTNTIGHMATGQCA